MSTQTPELRHLISVVEIDDARLIEGSAKTTISAEQVSPSHMLLKNRAIVSQGLEAGEGVFRVRVAVDVQIVPQGQPDAPPTIAFRVVHELSYRVPAALSFSAETLDSFARFNAVFNAWPYWREYVQNATAQMGLPRLILPVFRGGSESEPEAKSQDLEVKDKEPVAPTSKTRTAKSSKKR